MFKESSSNENKNFQINNAGLMSNLNMDEKPENIESMVKVNVLGPILVRVEKKIRINLNR